MNITEQTINPLPIRIGTRPKATPATPHMQLDQKAPHAMELALWEQAQALDHIMIGRSHVSEARSRALHVKKEHALGSVEAFFAGTEFAHVHGDGSGSMHLTLPRERATEAVEKGWGEPHPVVKMGFGYPTWLMIYGARNEADLAITTQLLRESHDFALGRNG